MTFIKLLEAGLSVGPWRLSRSQDSTQISVPGSFSLGSNCWCFLPFSFPILWRGPGRKACSLSASVGSGVSTGLLGKGLTPVFRSKVHKPHATPPLSSSRGAPVGVVVPLSAALPLHPRVFASQKKNSKTIDNAIRWTEAPHFSLFDSWGLHRFPDSLRVSEPYPHTSDRIPLSTSQLSGVGASASIIFLKRAPQCASFSRLLVPA